MPVKKYIKKKRKHIAIGDLDKYITLQSRNIKAATDDTVNFSEVFTGIANMWALIDSVSGETLFNSVGVEIDVTHHVYIRFLDGVTSESWVLLESGIRLDVIAVENIGNDSQWLFMPCTNRGLDTKAASGL